MEKLFKTNYILYMFAQTTVIDETQDDLDEVEKIDKNWIKAHNSISKDEFFEYFHKECRDLKDEKEFDIEEAWVKTQTEWLEYLKANVKEHVRAWYQNDVYTCRCHMCLNI